MGFIPAILNGLGITLFISLISLIICIIPGTLLYLAKRSKIKILYLISTAYIEFFEGIPLLAQIFFVFYVLPLISPILTVSQTLTAIIVLSLNGAANIVSFTKMFSNNGETTISIQNVIKTILLSIIRVFGEFIKYSTLLSMIGVNELLRVANSATMAKSDITVIIIAIAIYLVMNIIIKSIIKILQKAFNPENN